MPGKHPRRNKSGPSSSRMLWRALSTADRLQDAKKKMITVERLWQKIFEALDSAGIPLASCGVCFHRDLVADPRQITDETAAMLQDVCGDRDTATFLATLPCKCVLCHACLLRVARDVSGCHDEGSIAIPCPMCKQVSLLETNTVYVHSTQQHEAGTAIQRNNGLTTRAVFPDTGVADNRRPVLYFGAEKKPVQESPVEHATTPPHNSFDSIVIDADNETSRLSPVRVRVMRIREEIEQYLLSQYE